jgi:hypothetical protein
LKNTRKKVYKQHRAKNIQRITDIFVIKMATGQGGILSAHLLFAILFRLVLLQEPIYAVFTKPTIG